jgi:c-di-GMP phosphodiesterase
MWSWLKLGRAPTPIHPPAAKAVLPAMPVQPPPHGAFVAPEAAAQASVTLEGLGHRRPLVGRNGQVAGFELLLAPAVEKRLAARGDSPSVLLHYSALLSAAAGITAGGRAALVRLPALLLKHRKLADAAGAQTLLLVDELAAVPPEVATALRARGVRLGVPDGPPSAAPKPDFVALQASAGGIDTLLLSAQRWRELLPQVSLVGLGLQHLEDLENALRGGITLAGGQLGQSRVRPVSRPLGAAAHRICGLLNHLALDRDTAVIADEVRADATLTYRLLRYANSPAIGLQRAVEVVDDAVQLLGRVELQRWLSVQLLAAAQNRQAARALEEGALVRGRVLEAIARHRQEPNPGAHFTLGVLSLIEPLLQVPLADAVGPLRLGEEATAALLRREGPWAARLALLDALDAADQPGRDRADELAAGLDLEEGALAVIVDDAWGWSSQVRETTR